MTKIEVTFKSPLQLFLKEKIGGGKSKMKNVKRKAQTVVGFLAVFLNVQIFLKHFILFICCVGHFSFSKLFLNVAWYTLSAISWTNFFTPIDVRFFCFYFVSIF